MEPVFACKFQLAANRTRRNEVVYRVSEPFPALSQSLSRHWESALSVLCFYTDGQSPAAAEHQLVRRQPAVRPACRLASIALPHTASPLAHAPAGFTELNTAKTEYSARRTGQAHGLLLRRGARRLGGGAATRTAAACRGRPSRGVPARALGDRRTRSRRHAERVVARRVQSPGAERAGRLSQLRFLHSGPAMEGSVRGLPVRRVLPTRQHGSHACALLYFAAAATCEPTMRGCCGRQVPLM